VAVGELAFDVSALAGPGPGGCGVDPGGAPAGSAGPAGAVPPPPAEPLPSAVLGVERLDDDACLDLMVTADRSISRWQAVLFRAMARFAALRPPDELWDREPGRSYSSMAAHEVGPALAMSPATAERRLDLAFDLATRLPATLDALEAGRIDYGRAAAMAELTEPLSAEQARAVEQTVLARGGRSSHSTFRQAIRRAVLRTDPAGAAERRRDAEAGREVGIRPLEDGMAQLSLTLPAELAGAVYDRLTALARAVAADGDPRTLDQLRVDVAAALLLGACEHLHEAGEAQVEVHVTVPATTLLGLADDPGELEGYGPIPAETARELAEDGTWRRIVTDPVEGTVLDEGTRRFPSPRLARKIRTRDRTCRFPGCSRPARRADVDHTTRHTDDGPTAEANLSALCRRHHRLKDEAASRWSMVQPEPGVLVWTSPTGRVYTVDPTPADHFPPGAPGEAGEPGKKGRRRRPAHDPDGECSPDCADGAGEPGAGDARSRSSLRPNIPAYPHGPDHGGDPPF
jgi:hypothetical protein